jgi:hypothetical protein
MAIPFQSEELTLRFSGNRDKVLLFFTALQIESINPTVFPDPLDNASESKLQEVRTTREELPLPKNEQHLIKESIVLENERSGYYLVTNVFSDPELAKKWKEFLVSKGYSPMSFNNPNRNYWEYVYLLTSNDILTVYEQYEKLKQFPYFKELWILQINNK